MANRNTSGPLSLDTYCQVVRPLDSRPPPGEVVILSVDEYKEIVISFGLDILHPPKTLFGRTVILMAGPHMLGSVDARP